MKNELKELFSYKMEMIDLGTPEYIAASKEEYRLYDELKTIITPEQNEIFEEFLSKESEKFSIEEDIVFTTAFKFGAKVIFEALFDK